MNLKCIVLVAELSTDCKMFISCGNNDYEVLQLASKDPLHQIPKLSRPYSV